MTCRIHCPVCGYPAKRSRWTGRIKRHDWGAIGDVLWCRGDVDKTRGGGA